jgi:2C-methyl-D-erythritol 2,4-cyclodiphosphate synthase
MRIGQGFDVHAFGEGDFITLGGVNRRIRMAMSCYMRSVMPCWGRSPRAI